MKEKKARRLNRKQFLGSLAIAPALAAACKAPAEQGSDSGDTG